MKKQLLSIAISLCLMGSAAVAAEPVRIYIANDDHTDFMWTADEATYERVFQEMIDFHLRLTDSTRNNPAPFQNRFNCDGNYWLWVYEKKRTPEEFARVVAALKSGHLGAPLNALVSCYGAQPAEAVLRGLAYAGRLERKYGLRFSVDTAMENRTLPLGLASLWAGSGAKYSWRGICKSASRIPLSDREHEIYWAAGHDGQRVLMKWHSWRGFFSMGGYAEAFDPRAAVKHLTENSDFLSRYRAPGASEPYLVRGAFGFGWDALDRKPGLPYPPEPKRYPVSEHFHDVAQSCTTAERKVIVSNEEDFFQDFESAHGKELPTDCLTYGNQWDLYSATMAETSSRVRRAVEKLRPAEAMAALISLKQPDFLAGREAARDQAFIDLGLYWEHDWTADGAVTREARAAWQEKLAGQIESYVDRLHDDVAARLGGLIEIQGGLQRFYVFNPLGWPRTDAADVPYDGPSEMHVRDLAADADTPHQLETRDGKIFLRILARDIPAAGYKVFEIRRGRGDAPTDNAARVSGENNRQFENARVKLTLEDDGAIGALIDKSRPDYNLAGKIDELTINDLSITRPYRKGFFQIENSGPVSVTLKCVTDTGRNHTTRLTLLRDSDRIDIRNEITEALGEVKHWAFSFNLANPDVHTEEVGAVIRVKTKAQGGDYANKNARYDYATLNHFADITDGAGARGVTLSNSDCSFVKLGRSTPTQLDAATAQLNVLAGGQVDGEGFGIRNQHGATYFLHRFALRPHGGYDPVAAMKFALEHQNPLVAGAVSGRGGDCYPAKSFSILQINQPGVLLWAFKPAEEGIAQGLIARLWNLSPHPAQCSLRLNVPGRALVSARQATHIETDLHAIPVRDGSAAAAITGRQLVTLRLLPESGKVN